MTTKKTNFGNNIQDVLLLTKLDALRTSCHLTTKKVFQKTQVFHMKTSTQMLLNLAIATGLLPVMVRIST